MKLTKNERAYATIIIFALCIVVVIGMANYSYDKKRYLRKIERLEAKLKDKYPNASQAGDIYQMMKNKVKADMEYRNCVINAIPARPHIFVLTKYDGTTHYVEWANYNNPYIAVTHKLPND
jgi:hypothetical protein